MFQILRISVITVYMDTPFQLILIHRIKVYTNISFVFVSIQCQILPEVSELKLDSLDFNDFGLNKDEMLLASIRMFKDLGLIRKFRIDYEVMCSRVLSTILYLYYNGRMQLQRIICIRQRNNVSKMIIVKEGSF